MRAKVGEIPKRYQIEAILHRGARNLWRLTGKVHPSLVTGQEIDGRPVFLIHNPKCGGTTLKALFGIRAGRTTHCWPRQMFRRGAWRDGFFITSVRDPFERFLSSYAYHVKGGYRGKLVKRHGAAVKALSAFDYFRFIAQYPENLGAQSNWTDYPDPDKPHCDLILRLEDAANWSDVLRARGITLAAAGAAERRNSSDAGAGLEARLARLGLSADAAAELRRLVEARYRADCLRFGYPLHGPD